MKWVLVILFFSISLGASDKERRYVIGSFKSFKSDYMLDTETGMCWIFKNGHMVSITYAQYELSGDSVYKVLSSLPLSHDTAFRVLDTSVEPKDK